MAISDDKQQVAKAVSDIVAEEFIAEKMFGVCLPSAFILFEQLEKLHLNPIIQCGTLTYNEALTSPLHFWVDVEGVPFDPTRKITEFWAESKGAAKVSQEKYKFCPGTQKIVNGTPKEYVTMMRMFRHVKSSGSVNGYFDNGPTNLRNIRIKVDSRVKEKFGKCL